VIAWKEIILRFTDPIVLLSAIAVPLVIAAFINLSFGSLVLGRTIPDTNIPVGIVNQDRGGPWGNLGDIFVRAMIPAPDEPTLLSDPLFELFTVRQIEDETQARHLAERGKLIAALLIPPDFSEALATTESAMVKVYIDGREETRGVAFQSVVETLANMISAGEVTVRTTVEGLMTHPRTRAQWESGTLDEVIADLAVTAAMPESNPIKVQRVNDMGSSAHIEWGRYIAAAIAVLFAGFMALGSASLLQEKAQWTLQRMHITPTRPGIILAGKTVGAYLGSVIQMDALVGGMAAMEWVLSCSPSQGPKMDLIGLFLLILATPVAATGVGIVITGFARTYAQAANYGGAILLLMGLAGGVFFPVDLFPQPMQALSRITYHYWAMDGYVKLALGGSLVSILPNVLILGIMGLLLFPVGNWFLRRRMEFF
jgi:ABC-2 type transport system permease protein